MSGDYLGISPEDRAALTVLARLVGERRDAYVRRRALAVRLARSGALVPVGLDLDAAGGGGRALTWRGALLKSRAPLRERHFAGGRRALSPPHGQPL